MAMAAIRLQDGLDRPDNVPAPLPGEAEESPLGMDHHGPLDFFEQHPVAPVVGISHCLIHGYALLLGPLPGPVELPLAVAGRAVADADEPVPLDHDRCRERRGA